MTDLKKQLSIIVFIFLALFLYTRIAGPIQFSVNSVQTNKNDLFTTTGEGKAVAIPDIASLSIGITQNATTVSEAQKKINEVSKKITYSVKDIGIEEKYIKTTNYSVYPDYNYTLSRTITGYKATQNMEIKIKDIQKINQVIDTATSNGANIIGNVNFTFSDQLKAELEEKARKEAIDSAKKKAESLAKVSGIKLRKLINVVESDNPPVRVFTNGLGGARAIEEAEDVTNITPGEGTVSISITLYYETH